MSGNVPQLVDVQQLAVAQRDREDVVLGRLDGAERLDEHGHRHAAVWAPGSAT
jgi:hypothetical protein